jgi:Mlc titration factor MtfA (ptsG expression regulator)
LSKPKFHDRSFPVSGFADFFGSETVGSGNRGLAPIETQKEISMFHWVIDHRRKKLTQAPFPFLWEDILQGNVAHYGMLEDAKRVHLRALIQVFIAEKNWEGVGGPALTDEIRVTILDQACLLILNLPQNY